MICQFLSNKKIIAREYSGETVYQRIITRFFSDFALFNPNKYRKHYILFENAGFIGYKINISLPDLQITILPYLWSKAVSVLKRCGYSNVQSVLEVY